MGRAARLSDHTQLLDLCALHYVMKVYKNHTVRLHGRVIDIPRRADSTHATYAGKDVLVKHLLSGTTAYSTARNASHGLAAYGPSLQRTAEATTTKKNDGGDIFTAQSIGDISTVL